MQRSHQPHRLALALGFALAFTACSTANHQLADSGAADEGTDTAVAESDTSEAGRMREVSASKAQVAAYPRALAPPPPPAPSANLAYREAPSSLDRMEVTGSRVGNLAAPMLYATAPMPEPANTEKYAHGEDNPVHRTSEQPLSTFSIDVDTGSYSNVRRMLVGGTRPPTDAVRAEEFINYFDYGHAAPVSRETPFRVTTELAPAPWNSKRQLLMIGIKGYDVPKAEIPPANLVFLIDTSGSMDSPDKLPLVKDSLRQLVKHLRPQDRVSMVVYAGSAGLVLPPTSGAQRDDILQALDRLDAGGSTNGGDGIRLAYSMAKQAYIRNGVNRVILATDGDFNVGTVDQNALETLVADQRKSGIALTTLGFGQGNYNDELAEKLADVGDGNHAYIDTAMEARKVLVQEMGSTLLTIAKDVKIQIEFNPNAVAEYRLIGYENRVLNREDFANDKVDAGDIGAGHEVTALYEITPAGSGAERLPPLRYGKRSATAGKRDTTELAHLRLRYKRPGDESSRLIETPVLRSELVARPGESMRFATAVAAFADALRGGEQIGQWSWGDIAAAAKQSVGGDPWGQRRELLGLVEQARKLVAPEDIAVQVSE